MGVGVRKIKDPVHGYLKIPREICEDFIDTEIFQRLRNIEQTSMRWLFPGGRHDRFIHSLGVYQLACRIFDAIQENLKDLSCDEVLAELNAKELRATFTLAALLHDCGHAPFSHTFEYLYNEYADGSEHKNAFSALNDVVDAATRSDLVLREELNPFAPHEAMSAYVLMKFYKEKLLKHGVENPCLAVRMITGCMHPETHDLTIREQVENVFIGLLNGFQIDVDKLEYIIRDTWASGMQNFSIDIERLISGATIVVQKERDTCRLQFAYKMSALGVIQTVIDARNHLYEWIYGHHTVLYYSEMLKCAVYELGARVSSMKGAVVTDRAGLLAKMFSTDMFEKAVELVGGTSPVSVRLLSDGDLLYLMKRFCGDDVSYEAYVNHRSTHYAVWKTAAEYRMLIDVKHQYKIGKEACVRLVREKFGLDHRQCFACKDMSCKLSDIKDETVMIETSSGCVRSITTLANLPQHQKFTSEVKTPAFYMFLPKDRPELKDCVVNYINSLPVS